MVSKGRVTTSWMVQSIIARHRAVWRRQVTCQGRFSIRRQAHIGEAAHLKDGSSQADSVVATDRTTEQMAVQTGVSSSSRRWETAMPARKKYSASSTWLRAQALP